MGLGYLIIVWMILCAAALAILLLWAARRLWLGRRYRLLALLFLPFAGLCLWVAGWLLGVVLREPFWRFYF